MRWNTNPVQTKVATGATLNATCTLDDLPQVGNTILVAGVTSNIFNPANDGYEIDPENGSAAEFVQVSAWKRVVATGDDLEGISTFARVLSLADEWVLIMMEFEGTGPWTSLVVQDAAQSNSLAINSATISTGVTPGQQQPNDMAVAIVGFNRTLGVGDSSVTAFSNGFVKIIEGGTASGDKPYVAIAVKDIGNTIAGVETTATISEIERRPVALILTLKTDPPVTVRAYKSTTGYGGPRLDELANDVLPDQSRLKADQGGVYYRLVYIKNEENEDGLTATVVATIDQQPETGDIDIPSGVSFKVGVATEASGETVPAHISDTVLPAGVVFGNSAAMGNIPMEFSRGLWLEMTVEAFAPVMLNSFWHVQLDCEPL